MDNWLARSIRTNEQARSRCCYGNLAVALVAMRRLAIRYELNLHWKPQSTIAGHTYAYCTAPHRLQIPSTMDSTRSLPHVSSISLPDAQPPIRSCTFCRHRKIKCDRQHPCDNCTRGGRSAECTYPAGPGRRPKRSRQLNDAKVINRLDRLETIIKHLSTRPSSLANTGDDVNHPPADEIPVQESLAPNHDITIEQQLGRLVVDDTRSYYVGNIFWASLGKEVEELRNMLTEPDLEYGESSTDSSLPFDSDAAILGLEPMPDSLFTYHPLLSDSVKLLQIFKDNVVPVTKILHMPTVESMFWATVAAPESMSKDTEALLFAIYYCAVVSMTSSQCQDIFGVSREDLLQTHRFAVKNALARASLLKTENIVVLQAAVLFIEAFRNEDDTRAVWSLTALIVHIAKTMGLHRDGTAFGLKPFDIEIRRRLWYHICLLDIRSSEYHGYEPIVDGHSFDTKVPLHINDSDLSSEMTEPPAEREEACEMTLCRIRSEYMRLCWEINYVPPNADSSDPHIRAARSHKHRQALMEDFETRIELRHLRHCNVNEPFQLLTCTVARLMIARSRVSVYGLPGSGSSTLEGSNYESNVRDYIFQQSIGVLELSSLAVQREELVRWRWHTKQHIQWQSVAFVLSEICSRPPSPDCDRAWGYICGLFAEWETKKPAERGVLWTPIHRLLAKARYVREQQGISETVNLPMISHGVTT
nr:bikaverin cluster transcription factor bik5 [Quercus suber]